MSAKNSRRMKRVRDRFFVAQQGRCWLCGKPMLMTPDGKHPLCVSWDHVLPKSKGGGGDQSNLMLAHRRCNELRDNDENVRAIRW